MNTNKSVSDPGVINALQKVSNLIFRNIEMLASTAKFKFFDGKSISNTSLRSDKGLVYLIGAGPGDAELLTLKAHRLIQEADVVMYDWLVNPDIIKMIPAKVERIFVGKKCGNHSMKQADICDLMIEVAQTGKNIVRLKGGDPAIFARAGEECDMLVKHQIDFAIVPGITAASGASAYAGIPLTHRECAQSVRFITAHLKSANAEPNWSALANGVKGTNNTGETLVFYMGLKRIETIMKRLAENGLQASMPVAVIDQASTSQQRLCVGTLENITQKVLEADFKGPAVTIVGEVVNKRHNVDLSLLSKATRQVNA
ncbi:uroporphyrinogen-III C-methyltransferase [Paraglaciecola sp.]|uniref:uroporphyrinogen-III C-methyltransferase n=2 Tax=Paraglaciecola sp. TaxID=1920173 RepID=UPI00329837F1